ncbi:MAG: MFS transporter, partial [Acidimicrobiaceae bacterium]|nr:MFS transporter [Acidimicrobiaceae bacterium]
LSSTLGHTLYQGLTAHGVSPADASHASHLPPVTVLFAAFLGYNPIQQLVGQHALNSLSASNQAVLTGHSFFPSLISAPFHSGLQEAFLFAILASLVAAAASWARGAQYIDAGLLPPTATESAPERVRT